MVGLVQTLVLGGSCLLVVSWPDLEDTLLVDVDDHWKGKAALMEAGRPVAEEGKEELGKVTLVEDREGHEVELLVLEVCMEGQGHEEEGRLVLEADSHQQEVVGE